MDEVLASSDSTLVVASTKSIRGDEPLVQTGNSIDYYLSEELSSLSLEDDHGVSTQICVSEFVMLISLLVSTLSSI